MQETAVDATTEHGADPGTRAPADDAGNSLARNGAAVMATTGVNAGTGYLFWIVAAWALTADDLGRASSAVAAVGLVTLLADLGLTTTIVADLPGRADRHRFLAIVFRAGFAASLLGAVVALGVLHLFVDELRPLLGGAGTVVFTVAVIGMTLGRYSDQVAVADRRAHLMLLRNAGFAVGKLVALAAAGWWFVTADGADLPARTVITMWGLAAVASILVIARRLDLGLATPTSLAAGDRRLVTDSSVHHLANLGGEIPMFLLPIIVLTRAGAEAAGVFYITWMVASMVFTVSAAMSASLLAEARHDPDALAALTKRTLSIIGVILVLGLAGTAVAGSTILGLFGGDVADGGTTLLLVLALSAVPDGVTNVWVSRWRATDRHSRAAGLNVVMALIALAWSWWRVPVDGVVAVGWSWVLCQTTGCVLIALAEIADRFGPSAPTSPDPTTGSSPGPTTVSSPGPTTPDQGVS